MQSQNGILLVSSLISLGLITLFLFLFLGHFQALQALRITRHSCRTDLIELHQDSMRPSEKALSLNHALSALNKSIQLSKAALVLSPKNMMALKLLSKAKRARNKIIQLQNSFLISSQTIWQSKSSLLYLKNNFSHQAIYQIRTRNMHLDLPNWLDRVRRKDPRDPYSLLEFTPNLEKLTLATMVWSQVLKERNGILKWQRNLVTKLGCQAYVKQISDQQFEVKLTEDKSLSNVRFFF